MNMDFINNGQAQGQVASALMANGSIDPNRMRPFINEDGKAYISVFKGGDAKKPENYSTQPVTNATLRRDEWKYLDEAVLKISETRLNGIADLIEKGLTFQIGNGMGSTVLETHDVSDALGAELTMDGVNRAKNDRQVYTTNYLPLPIIHADYEINARVLASSRNMGASLDVGMAEKASRKVSEKLESLLFTALPYSFGGGTIYGYLNEPNRNQVTLSTGWDDSSKTARGIKDEV